MCHFTFYSVVYRGKLNFAKDRVIGAFTFHWVVEPSFQLDHSNNLTWCLILKSISYWGPWRIQLFVTNACTTHAIYHIKLIIPHTIITTWSYNIIRWDGQYVNLLDGDGHQITAWRQVTDNILIRSYRYRTYSQRTDSQTSLSCHFYTLYIIL